MIKRKVPSIHAHKSVADIMAMKRVQGIEPQGIDYTSIPISEQEGQHDFNLQRFRAFYQGLLVRRTVLPNDTKKSQPLRQMEFNRQSAMPWGNQFMVTATDKDRLDNPSQIAAVSQRQLAPPSTYGQFYAFMNALSAAFGTIR